MAKKPMFSLFAMCQRCGEMVPAKDLGIRAEGTSVCRDRMLCDGRIEQAARAKAVAKPAGA